MHSWVSNGLEPNLKIIFHIVDTCRSVILIATIHKLLFILLIKIITVAIAIAIAGVTAFVTADVVIVVMACPRWPHPTLILPAQISTPIGERPV